MRFISIVLICLGPNAIADAFNVVDVTAGQQQQQNQTTVSFTASGASGAAAGGAGSLAATNVEFRPNQFAAVFEAPWGSCAEISAMAEDVLARASTWIADRKTGVKRLVAEHMAYFQHKETCPPRESGRLSCGIYFDAFEFLGILHKKSRQQNCAADKTWKKPAWPWDDTVAPELAPKITPLPKAGNLFRYLETMEGFVTDLYFCPKEIPAADLQSINGMLTKLTRQSRLEESDDFKAFTDAREKACGESDVKQVKFSN
jgi:hypothetical protein